MKWEIIAPICGCVLFSILVVFAAYCLHMALDTPCSDEDCDEDCDDWIDLIEPF